MRVGDIDVLEAEAGREPAFSNGTELDWWQAAHCGRCAHDAPARAGDWENACVLLAIALQGLTPAQWLSGEDRDPGSRYVCVEFREEGTPDPTPRPIPDPPGQAELLPRGPYTGVRTLSAWPARGGLEVGPAVVVGRVSE